MDLAELGLRTRYDQVIGAVDALNKFTPAAAKAEDEVEKLGNESEKAAKKTGSLRNSVLSLISPMDLLKGAVIGFVGGLSIQAVGSAADKYTEFSNRLKVAGVSASSMSEVQERLFTSANKAGASINTVGELYQKASQNSKELGASQEKLLSFVDGITAALKVNGGSAAAASGALTQLGQALGAGTIRAEEFNSILEGAPTIAQAAAQGIAGAGGSVAKLRKMVIDGSLSSKAFFDGFLKGSENMRKTADGLSLTLSASFQTLSNGFIAFIGSMDQALGVSSTLASGIQSLGETLTWLSMNFDTIATTVLALSPVLLGVFGPTLISAITTVATLVGGPLLTAIGALTTGFKTLALVMLTNPLMAIATALTTAAVLIYKFREELGLTTGKWAELWSSLSKGWEAVTQAIDRFWKFAGPVFAKVWENIELLVVSIGQKLVAAFEYFYPIAKAVVDGLVTGFQAVADLIDYISGRNPVAGIGAGITGAAEVGAQKFIYAHQVGSNAGGETIKKKMVEGGEQGGERIKKKMDEASKMTAEKAKAAYEELNGKLNETFTAGAQKMGEYIYNKATGAITYAGKDAGNSMKEGTTEGGKQAGQIMQKSISAGGSSAGDSIYAQLARFGDVWSNSMQKFIGDIIGVQIRLEQSLLRAQIALTQAETRAVNKGASGSRAGGSGSSGGGSVGIVGGTYGGGGGSIGRIWQTGDWDTSNPLGVYHEGNKLRNKLDEAIARGDEAAAQKYVKKIQAQDKKDARRGVSLGIEEQSAYSKYFSNGEFSLGSAARPQPTTQGQAGAGGGGSNYTIINQISPADQLAALNSKAGQQVIYNIIRSDPQQMREILGVY